MEIRPSHVINMNAGTLDISSHTLRTGDLNRNGATFTPSTGTVVFDTSTSHSMDVATYYNVQLEPVAATNLIGHWKLDERQGTLANDYGSGNNAGTLTGAASWVETGLPSTDYFNSGAVNLHGTASNDYIDIAAAAVSTSSPFSACAWIDLNALSGTNTFISQDGATNISAFFLTRQSGGKFAMNTYDGDAVSANIFAAVGTTTAVAVPGITSVGSTTGQTPDCT